MKTNKLLLALLGVSSITTFVSCKKQTVNAPQQSQRLTPEVKNATGIIPKNNWIIPMAVQEWVLANGYKTLPTAQPLSIAQNQEYVFVLPAQDEDLLVTDILSAVTLPANTNPNIYFGTDKIVYFSLYEILDNGDLSPIYTPKTRINYAWSSLVTEMQSGIIQAYYSILAPTKNELYRFSMKAGKSYAIGLSGDLFVAPTVGASAFYTSENGQFLKQVYLYDVEKQQKQNITVAPLVRLRTNKALSTITDANIFSNVTNFAKNTYTGENIPTNPNDWWGHYTYTVTEIRLQHTEAVQGITRYEIKCYGYTKVFEPKAVNEVLSYAFTTAASSMSVVEIKGYNAKGALVLNVSK